MDLYVAALVPGAAAAGELGWLRHFGQAQQVAIKRSCTVLATGWNGDLHVVDPFDLHVPIL